MKVITDKKNIVIFIGEQAEVKGSNIFVGNNTEICGANELSIYDIAVIPEDVKPQKYLYDGTNFTVNPNYVEYKTQEQINADLQNQMQTLSQTVAQMQLG